MILSDNRTPPHEDGIGNSGTAEAAVTVDNQDDKFWITTFKQALSAANTYQQEKLRPAWSRNYRSFSNRHMNGSKYDTYRYRNRSKLFKPKTRMAVRKNDATAAGAMFSTEDVVSITPERASDKLQVTTARFIHEALNYRLDSSNKRSGPNWFMTAIGARQDSQLTGICVSKQFWEFEERTVQTMVEKPAIDMNGLPMTDPETGAPVMEETVEESTKVIRDRLMITLLPPEHAFIDPTADWRDPIQDGGYFIAGYPMRLDDLEDMIVQQSARPVVGGGAWRTDIDVRKLTQGRGEGQRQAKSVRQAREDGIDRYESRHAGKDKDVIWIYECFYRTESQDWHYWMLGETMLLADPRPVEESYPEQEGDRPYVCGVGSLESHKTHPMAPVESWQPMQMEMNDITNLQLDAMKMAISPITKIRKGRGVDLKQVQNRGPDAAILVEDMDDVGFDRAPSPDGASQQAMNYLSNDFDELAGVFSTGSVQSNRALNETVGGMQLMSASSNALTEFDLRVWVETWVEPTLHQCVRLIKYFESDEVVIAVAGEKAGLIGNIGADDPLAPPQTPPQAPPQGGAPGPDGQPAPEQEEQREPPVPIGDVLGNLDKARVSVRVNVGIGAMDSRQKLEKFMAGMNVTKEMAPLLAAQNIEPNAIEMLQEAWGLVGYRDADRFFMKAKPKEPEGPPPEAQMEMLKQKGVMESKTLDGKIKTALEQMKLQASSAETQQETAIKMRELALQEREFAHQQRMDQFEASMRQQQEVMSRIERALGAFAPQTPQPAPTGF